MMRADDSPIVAANDVTCAALEAAMSARSYITRAIACAFVMAELCLLSARPAGAASIQCDTVHTLGQLIALGSSGCEIRAYGVHVYDFSYSITGTAGADEIAASDVLFTRGGVPSALILEFGEWSVEPDQTLAVTLGYSFAGERLLSANQFVFAEPWDALLEGAATLTTTLCKGDTFPCGGGTLAQLSDAGPISIAGIERGSVEMSLLLDGRLLDDVPITVHSGATVFGVPEPPLWALIGGALVVYGLRRRRPGRPFDIYSGS
jgi:hypothetical protein